MPPPGLDPGQGDTVRSALEDGIQCLTEAGVETPVEDAKRLLAAAAGVSPLGILLQRERRIAPQAAESYQSYIEARAARRPVSRILGRRGFWDLEFAINDAVLDPRPESETVVEAVLARLDDRKRSYRILDLGVGSGCLLLSLLGALARSSGVGVDLSPLAVVCAEGNAAALGLSARSDFLAGDWGRAVAARFDIIVANPPYIPDAEIAGLAPEVSRHDPRLALAGGVDGLSAYRRLAPDLFRLLGSGGFAVVECGAGQVGSLCNWSEVCIYSAGYDATLLGRKYSGRRRGFNVCDWLDASPDRIV